jgi:PAS domain S-box-containing protein
MIQSLLLKFGLQKKQAPSLENWDSFLIDVESMVKSILDSSEDMILILNENAEIIEVNHSAEKVFGLSRESARGQSIYNVIKGGTLLNDLNGNLQNRTAPSDYFSVRHERTVFNKNCEMIPVSVFLSRVRNGNSLLYPLYLRDLTEIKKAEIELERSRAQMVVTSKLTSLGEMAGGIAHEINTPLAIIQMRTDQLLDQVKDQSLTDEFLLKALEGIEITVRRIAKIVRSLRSFARDGSKDPFSNCLLNHLIEETFGLCKEKFNNHGVELTFTNPDNIEFGCRPGEISQVLLNLLNNAFDAIKNQDVKWIKVSALVIEQNKLRIEVTDSGPGIRIDFHDKIMTPFFTTKEVGKSPGLGLSISKGIIESHGGRLYLNNSSLNTQFVIELPTRSAQEAAS